MAILSDCPGLEVKIIANDQALAEYADAEVEDLPKTVTNFVEVNSGGAFKVHFSVSNYYTHKHGLCMDIILDGNKVVSALYAQGRLKKDGGHTRKGVMSKVRGKWHSAEFLFSEFAIGKLND
jgi:hypothetical protein